MTAGAATHAIAAACREAGVAPPAAVARLGGGCIHDVRRVELADGTVLVAKVATDAARRDVLRGEARGLACLDRTSTAAGGPPVPRVRGTHDDDRATVLLMDWLEPARADGAAWGAFGAALARLHAATPSMEDGAPVRGYGFDRDNHLGDTPQPNRWADDWPAFVREQRLGPLRDRAATTLGGDVAVIDRVLEALDDLLPARPAAGLVHGDLWSGNAHPCTHDGGVAVAIIDPAPSVSDPVAELGMMRLFGGFPEACFDAWDAGMREAGVDLEGLAAREGVFRLYHLLNHVVLFGGGYAGQAAATARALLRP